MGAIAGDWATRAVQAAREAIITVGADGSVVEVNPSAEAMFGGSRTEIVGRPVDELIVVPPIEPERSAPTPTLGEGRVRRRDGAEVDVEVSVVRSADEPLLATAILREHVAATADLPDASRMERLLAAAQDLAQIGAYEIDLGSGIATWSDGVHRILGLENGPTHLSAESMLDWVHPRDRPRIDALLAAMLHDADALPEDGVAAEFRVVRPEGSVRELRMHGVAQRDEGERAVRWAGVVQDVTAERVTDDELQAHFAVSQALRQWESFEEGIMDLLRRLGTALHYEMGSVWHWDAERDALVCRAFWHQPDIDPEGFDVAKRSLVFRPGEGKPGLAWERQEPVITPDVAADPVFRPKEAAIRRGVTCGLAFPALADDGPVAVLSYYGFERRVPSPSLVRTLTSIGRELGRFLARRRAQLGPQPLTARELEILRLAADGLSGPAIADHLVVSPSTVKTHFENIYEKLGVSDRAAAVAYALRAGLMT